MRECLCTDVRYAIRNSHACQLSAKESSRGYVRHRYSPDSTRYIDIFRAGRVGRVIALVVVVAGYGAAAGIKIKTAVRRGGGVSLTRLGGQVLPGKGDTGEKDYGECGQGGFF